MRCTHLNDANRKGQEARHWPDQHQVLRHVNQHFPDCAILDGLVRVSCVCEREPEQRQAGVFADGHCLVYQRECDVFYGRRQGRVADGVEQDKVVAGS